MANIIMYQLVILVFVGIYISDSQTTNHSKNLLSDVLKTHEKLVRPSFNQSLPTTVQATFKLLKLHYFDEVEGRLSVAGVLNLGWTDDLIQWDTTLYGGIMSHMFSPTNVWYPAYVLIYPEGKYENYVKDWMTIRISHNGQASINLPAVYMTSCEVDITYYPFDTQICSLNFKPWGYTHDEIRSVTSKNSVKGRGYMKHGEWDIEDSLASIDGNNIVFTFKLRRKPLFLVVNMIFPIILMSFLNTLIFALPPQSGERVSYGITILLAIAVFLTLVGDNLPKTSNPMSILSFYLMINLTLSTMMCVTAIFNLRCYYKESSEGVPFWARCAIQVTCTKSCMKSKQQYKAENNEHGKSTRQDNDKKMKDALTWVDASRAVDRISMVFFLLSTIGNTVTFILLIVYETSASSVIKPS